MPKAYEKLHGVFMKDLFLREAASNKNDQEIKKKSNANLFHRERTVYPINKKGYLLPSTIMIKLFPELYDGVRIIGFLNEEDEFAQNRNTLHYMLIDLESIALLGITEF